MYIHIYIYIYIHTARSRHARRGGADLGQGAQPGAALSRLYSGGRLCTLIGVPCRLSMLSTFNTFANVLFQYKSPRAEGAKTDPPPGYSYEGTQTTA